MANWLAKLFGKKRFTPAELEKAREDIRKEISSNIHVLRNLPATRARTKAIVELNQLRRSIRTSDFEIVMAHRELSQLPYWDPIHDAAMRTSWKINRSESTRRKGAAAIRAREIIQKHVHMHALREKKRVAKRVARLARRRRVA